MTPNLYLCCSILQSNENVLKIKVKMQLIDAGCITDYLHNRLKCF